MKNEKVKVAWAYVVEPTLALLLVVLGCLTIGVDKLSILVHQFAIDVATLYCAVFFGAALAFLWTFYSKADTDFCTWLDEKNALQVYLHATMYAVAVERIATLSLLATKIFTGTEVALIAAFLFLMAVINSYTLVKNVIGLMKLHTLFNRVSRRNGASIP